MTTILFDKRTFFRNFQIRALFNMNDFKTKLNHRQKRKNRLIVRTNERKINCSTRTSKSNLIIRREY